MEGTCHLRQLINKYIGEIYEADCDYSPYDVVGWRGNYSPYKYDLNLFNAMGSISFDHPDPCLLTVLSSRSYIEGYSFFSVGHLLWTSLSSRHAGM